MPGGVLRRPRERVLSFVVVAAAIGIAGAAVAQALVGDGDPDSEPRQAATAPPMIVRSPSGPVEPLALVAEIRVPRPLGVTVAAGSVWVVNGLDGTVARIDPELGVVADVIELEIRPSRLVAGPTGPWALDEQAGVAILLDPATGRPARRLTLGPSTLNLAFAGGDAWVSTLSPPSVLRLDPTDDSLVASVPVPDPSAVSAASEASVWVAGDGRSVYRLDPATNRVAARIRLGDAPGDLLAAPEAVWVAHPTSATLSRIDPGTSRVTARVELQLGSAPLFLAGGEGALWVESITHLLRVDPATNRVVAALPLALGRRPGPEPLVLGGLAAGEGSVWVADTYGDAVLRVDPGGAAT